ncbi:unnamed protein product [Thlaspi arvense]|uniref:Uncharacterized protein n=1 Tax=Thlaspi arvense TaxID=13288 RepID=A0AAU9RKC9_THLAR|nr:unnamed protein product [Thlaspi arvense]
MSDEQLIKLTIYYGGAMAKEDEDYNYREKLGFKTLFWKLSEIKWLKFEEFISDMEHLSSAAKSAGEVDVFLEHSCGGDEIDGGYEPDQDEGMVEEGDESGDDNSDEDNRPPKEDDDPEESEDEAPVKEKEKDGNCLNEMKNQEDENQNVEEGLMENQNANVRLPEIDEGDDVIIDVGNGGDDDRTLQFPPKRQPKPRKLKVNPLSDSQSLPTGESTNIEAGGNSSQLLQPDQLTTEIPAASSAPQPSVSSNKPLPKKRGRPLKTRKVENIPRGVGTFYSPYTGKAFEVFGDRVYDMSNNDPQPPPS